VSLQAASWRRSARSARVSRARTSTAPSTGLRVMRSSSSASSSSSTAAPSRLPGSRASGRRPSSIGWAPSSAVPSGPPESDEDARERRDAWRSWRTLVDRLVADVRIETEARANLERRYLGGHPVLFPDAEASWAKYADHVERLFGLAEVTEPAGPTKRPSGGASIAARVEALATWLADDARVKAYEIVGDRERAVSIMERRLGA